jgi:hypothetical protein
MPQMSIGIVGAAPQHHKAILGLLTG